MYQLNRNVQNQTLLRPSPIGSVNPIRVCILGGGFAGLYTALHLRRFSRLKLPNYQITLIEQRDHFVFTPLLYEVITGELQAWEVAPSYRKLLGNSTIQFRQAEVEGVNLQQRFVRLQNDEVISYHYLVLALGGEPRLTSVPGVMDYAQPFRTIRDAEHLKERLRFLEASEQPVIRVAIAGAGPNGVELACKLADRLKHRGQIHLIDRGEQILNNFSQGSRIAAYRALAKRGVNLQLETNIELITPKSITLTRDHQIHELATDLVLWTGGTQSIQWIRDLSCRHNPQGQLLTHPTLQLVDYPEVFALGDLAEIQAPNGNPVPATAQAAFQQAPCAANNLRALLTGYPLQGFRYLHLGEMLTLGTNAAVVSSFGIILDGHLARIIRRGVYIQRLPTFRHRLQVAIRWLTKGLLRHLW